MLADFLQFEFLQRAFVAGVLLAAAAPLVGMFLVMRRLSLFADVLSHVSLLGVALGVFFGLPPTWSALGTALLAALGMERIGREARLLGEAVLALFLSGSLALAVILLSLSKGLNVGLVGYLFGSLSTVTPGDVLLIAAVSLSAALFAWTAYRGLFLIALDEDLAHVSGFRVRLYNLALLMFAAAVVALLARVVGVLLVGALMVVPVFAALQFGSSFARTFLIAETISILSMLAGLFLSYAYGVPLGGAVVVVTLLFFGASFVLRDR